MQVDVYTRLSVGMIVRAAISGQAMSYFWHNDTSLLRLGTSLLINDISKLKRRQWPPVALIAYKVKVFIYT